jgi:hypothetical protein
VSLDFVCFLKVCTLSGDGGWEKRWLRRGCLSCGRTHPFGFALGLVQGENASDGTCNGSSLLLNGMVDHCGGFLVQGADMVGSRRLKLLIDGGEGCFKLCVEGANCGVDVIRKGFFLLKAKLHIVGIDGLVHPTWICVDPRPPNWIWL